MKNSQASSILTILLSVISLCNTAGPSIADTPQTPKVSSAAATHNPDVEKPSPDQSTVALKSLPATISATDPSVKSALAPSDKVKAAKLIGKKIDVLGTVDSIYSPDDHDVVLLDFDKDYKNDIAVAALSPSYAKLPNLQALQGKHVLVSGTVTMYKGRPEILLTSATQIKTVQ